MRTLKELKTQVKELLKTAKLDKAANAQRDYFLNNSTDTTMSENWRPVGPYYFAQAFKELSPKEHAALHKAGVFGPGIHVGVCEVVFNLSINTSKL